MSSSHLEHANAGNWYRNRNALPHHVAIHVDQLGQANFSRIQAAIDFIPSNNKQWFCIHVKAGIYREKVKIPSDKPYLILEGEGERTTFIVWGDHDSTLQSPTFMSSADNIVVRNISFVNKYNFLDNNKPLTPAVAAMISGDKSAFYQCDFAGVQDTLWDDQGRHYFKDCTILGAVDFIFGSGGYVTAQGRSNPNDANGFVFKMCNIFGTGPTYLGRPWRAYSRVIFYKCYFANVIDPRGWNPWNFLGQENRITYVEYENYGPGAASTQRVNWVKKLSPQAIDQFTSLSFINSGNWIQRQPSC
ncbi:hypothetical protein MANES_03G001000v8 [Manihot esculenta]|uniref:Uncharacterized protein n=1 Tax=Manihot esculenta TaxID=3983 RepID=A0ACB7HY74_MANES|nr:hypothetical protein MANES_03G001000v8 [Manihot esculenta]